VNQPFFTVAKLFTVVAIMVGASVLPTRAQQQAERIVAVINNDAITISGLHAQIRLILTASGVAPTSEIISRIQDQILQLMIEDKLREQEIRRSNITVSDEDLHSAIDEIAHQNHLTYRQFITALRGANLEESALERQVWIQVGWQRLVQERLIPTVNVTDTEIDEAIQRIDKNREHSKYLLADIFLAVHSPDQESNVHHLANQLVHEIQRGASFQAVAHQFSQTTAANGGDLGWIMAGQLEPMLDSVLPNLYPGQISSPVRTATGFHILLMREKQQVNTFNKEARVRIARVGFRLAMDASSISVAQAITKARNISSIVHSCEELTRRGKQLGFNDISGETRRFCDFPPFLQILLRDIPNNRPTEPQRLPNGINIFMVCERMGGTETTEAIAAINREKIAESIGEQRVNMMQWRLLRDLRSAAYIDIQL
jgi:peptidyl-prolyl cis-trans isomerase SurA